MTKHLLWAAVCVAGILSAGWMFRYEVHPLDEKENIGVQIHDRWTHDYRYAVWYQQERKLVVFTLGNLATPLGVHDRSVEEARGAIRLDKIAP